jgi:hypothetical protein
MLNSQNSAIQQRRHNVNNYRRTAIIVGILYIIGTVAGILSVIVTGPIFDASDYLAKVAANPNQLRLGGLFVLTMGLALAMVPVLLFPIFRKINEVLAVGYVVFRGALETVGYMALVGFWLLLAVLSREYTAAGASAAPYFQTLAALLRDGGDAIGTIMTISFCLGALMLYTILYQSQLVPRWISVWGFIAILLNLATAFLMMFKLMTAFSTLNMVMNFPIFLQEMVMAVWLIAKGFNPAALASLPAKTTTRDTSGAS